MTNPIQLIKMCLELMLLTTLIRTICATWNREYAQNALDYHIKSLEDEGNTEVLGSWD
jgi:hypothetical protein